MEELVCTMPFVAIIEINVAAQFVSQFMKLLDENKRQTLAFEAGCRTFNILTERRSEIGCVVLLYEVYDSAQTFADHLATAHFLAFDDATKPMIKTKVARSFDLHGVGEKQ